MIVLRTGVVEVAWMNKGPFQLLWPDGPNGERPAVPVDRLTAPAFLVIGLGEREDAWRGLLEGCRRATEAHEIARRYNRNGGADE